MPGGSTVTSPRRNWVARTTDAPASQRPRLLLDFIAPLFFASLLALGAPAQRLAGARFVPALPVAVQASFRPLSREVTNWRSEAGASLDAPLLARASIRLGGAPRAVSRCVRLNNYWCIKRAGWAGEIAADTEGHVAFASAQEGAIVAAVLLRKYYVEYKRHSAQAIVSHWAPANCGFASAASGTVAHARALAPRGLRATLRGRWLAAHGRGSVGARGIRQGPRVRPSIVAERLVPMLRAPTIAVGVSEIPLAAIRLASLTFGELPSLPGKTGAPAASCASETQRIANYAARASVGIVAGPDDDLGLFDADGNPAPNLALLMENMSGVEIGPLKAQPELVAGAITQLVAQRRAAITPPASSN